MSDLFIRNIPSIEKKEFKYRSRINSHDLNELQEEAFNDILDLFNKANSLQKTVYEMNLSHEIENVCYENRLAVALNDLAHLKEQYDNITGETDYRTQTVYACDAVGPADGTFAATIDKNTNTIVSNIVSSISKIRLHDDTYDENLIPQSLQVYIGPDSFTVGTKIQSIEDSDIMNAFDGKNDTVWIRKVTTTPSVDHIDNEIVIGLPEDIITTRLMNQIVLKPFPAGYIDILDIKYKSNGAWTTIPGFDKYQGYEERTALDEFGNEYTYGILPLISDCKFTFPAVQSNQIKIKIRQSNYEFDEENNRKIFYLGFRDINVNYVTYTNNQSTFDMVYDFPELNRNIKIYDTEIVFNNNITEDENFGIAKEFYYYDATGMSHKVAETCPFILEGHKLRIRFTIDGNQKSPNIRACKVKYKLS